MGGNHGVTEAQRQLCIGSRGGSWRAVLAALYSWRRVGFCSAVM
jgi:hypothetical protein